MRCYKFVIYFISKSNRRRGRIFEVVETYDAGNHIRLQWAPPDFGRTACLRLSITTVKRDKIKCVRHTHETVIIIKLLTN